MERDSLEMQQVTNLFRNRNAFSPSSVYAHGSLSKHCKRCGLFCQLVLRDRILHAAVFPTLHIRDKFSQSLHALFRSFAKPCSVWFLFQKTFCYCCYLTPITGGKPGMDSFSVISVAVLIWTVQILTSNHLFNSFDWPGLTSKQEWAVFLGEPLTAMSTACFLGWNCSHISGFHAACKMTLPELLISLE